MQVIYELCCLNEKKEKKRKKILQLYGTQQMGHLPKQNPFFIEA